MFHKVFFAVSVFNKLSFLTSECAMLGPVKKASLEVIWLSKPLLLPNFKTLHPTSANSSTQIHPELKRRNIHPIRFICSVSSESFCPHPASLPTLSCVHRNCGDWLLAKPTAGQNSFNIFLLTCDQAFGKVTSKRKIELFCKLHLALPVQGQ